MRSFKQCVINELEHGLDQSYPENVKAYIESLKMIVENMDEEPRCVSCKPFIIEQNPQPH